MFQSEFGLFGRAVLGILTGEGDDQGRHFSAAALRVLTVDDALELLDLLMTTRLLAQAEREAVSVVRESRHCPFPAYLVRPHVLERPSSPSARFPEAGHWSGAP